MYNRISDANPQLMREIKGRFNLPKVLLAFSISLILQGLVLLLYWLRLPSPNEDSYNPYSYCYPKYINSVPYNSEFRGSRSECLYDVFGNIVISWNIWWSHISLVLSAIAITALLIGGLFLLINNLIDEQEKGNLNFIRLSPQPGSKIMLGKLLGVPCLLYFGIAAAVPLQTFAATHAGYGLGDIFRFYSLVSAGIFTIYSLVMLYGMSGGKQPLAFSLIIGSILSYLSLVALYYLFPVNQFSYLRDEGIWFNLMLLKTPMYAQLFWIVSCVIISGFIFQMISRRYQKPNSTLITKKQSYIVCAAYNLYALGFLVGYLNTVASQRSVQRTLEAFTTYNIVLLLFLLGLALSLSPNRQNLQDWARYRHSLVQSEGKPPYSLLGDLLWGEKSPSILAMAINLSLSLATVVMGILTWNHQFLEPEEAPFLFSLGILILFGWLASYSVLVQCLSFTSTASKNPWVIRVVLLLLIIGPIILLVLFDSRQPHHLDSWLLFVFGSSPWLVNSPRLWTNALQLLLAQALGIGLMVSLFTYELRRAGQSELKRLMRDSPAKTFSKVPKGS
ncbi:MAG: hypothetical protein EA395_09410 [Phormidium sp. GEM2.Bin31]|nr:MAG: hypothetical protein EA395_09410 [Phormidium sp. GEM2.Bin31]